MVINGVSFCDGFNGIAAGLWGTVLKFTDSRIKTARYDFLKAAWYMVGSVHGGADFADPNDNPKGKVMSPSYGWNPVSESYAPATKLNEKWGYWAGVYFLRFESGGFCSTRKMLLIP
jgi:hypothetical protein